MKRLNHSLKINLLFAVIIIFLITAVFLVNGIALRASERFNLQLDLTHGAMFEISDNTRHLLATLDVPVEIFVLADISDFGRSPYLIQAQRIIEQYPRFSGMVSLEYVDYAANPLFAVNFPELSLSHGDIIIRSGDRAEQVFFANLFHFSQSPDGSLNVIASRAEEALISAIFSVVSDDNVRIALLAGNGASDGGMLLPLLASNNYEVQTVSMASPALDGFDVLLLLSPTIDLSEEMVRALEAFLYNEGRYGKMLLYTASVAQGALPNLDMFLAEWGISFADGAVFETNPERTYSFQPFYPTAEYVDDRYVVMLRDPSMPFLMPLARPMELMFTSRDGFHVETLLTFSASSGVRPADAGQDFSAADATWRGPIPALVSSSFNHLSADDEHLQSFIVASASTAIFDPIALQNTSVTNAEYLLNLLGDLMGREFAANIQPVSLAGRTLGITSAEATRLGVILVGVVPMAILLTGVAVWLYRRFK